MKELGYFKDVLAILDAILKITPFQWSDFGKLLVCYSGHLILQKTVEKPFVTIFLGSNHILTRLFMPIYGDLF